MTNHPVVRRDSSHRVLGGVCAGLARSWDVDPLLVRAGLLVACAVSMGFAVLGYLLLWIAVPSDRRTLQQGRAWSPGALIVGLSLLVLVIGLALPPARSTMIGAALLIALGAAWYAASRTGRRAPSSVTQSYEGGRPYDRPPTSEPQWVQPPMPVHAALSMNAGAYAGQPYLQGPARRRPRAWARVALLTLLAWATLAIANSLGANIGGVAYPASALAVVGLALIGASRPSRVQFGRPRGLVGTGLLAALVTLAMLLPTPTTAARGYQAISSLPQSETVLDVGMGTHTVDLSGLGLDRDQTLTITSDMGMVTVVLPAHTAVDARYVIDAGSLTTPQSEDGGMDLDVPELYPGQTGRPTLTLTVQVGLGNIEVRR